MVNLLCNLRKISFDKRTKSAMASQVKHKGLAELRGAEGAYHLLHISTGIEAKSIPSNDLLILLTPPRFSDLPPSLTCNALVDLDCYLVLNAKVASECIGRQCNNILVMVYLPERLRDFGKYIALIRSFQINAHQHHLE